MKSTALKFTQLPMIVISFSLLGPGVFIYLFLPVISSTIGLPHFLGFTFLILSLVALVTFRTFCHWLTPLESMLYLVRELNHGALSPQTGTQEGELISQLKFEVSQWKENFERKSDLVEAALQGDFTALQEKNYLEDRLDVGLQRLLQNLQDKVQLAQDLAQGNFLKFSKNINKKDPLGDSLQAIMDSLTLLMREATNNSGLLASSSKSLSQVSSEIAAVIHEVDLQIESSVKISQDISTALHNVSSTTNQLNQKMQQVSSNSTSNREHLQSITLEVEKMGHSIKDTSAKADHALMIATQAQKKTFLAVEEMEKVHKASQTIGNVINILKDLSNQMNLLALNATIEAASAGPAGKGFSIIALAIKELADQSTESAVTIGKEILTMQYCTNEALLNIHDMEKIVNNVQGASEGINSLTRKQNKRVQQIRTKVNALADNVTATSGMMEQSTADAHSVVKNCQVMEVSVQHISENLHQTYQRTHALQGKGEEVEQESFDLAKLANRLNSIITKFKFSALPDISTLKILYAEDNAINRKLGIRILEQGKAQVVTANDGQEAIQLLMGEPFDVVLMDVKMPILDGLEATRRIRSGNLSVLDPKIPIIALTAGNTLNDRNLCKEAGMSSFLNKPLIIQDLFEILHKITKAP